ncbi:hypothetical protein Tco_0331449 [Tanacetum coccineum]
MRINPGIKPKEPSYQVVLDALALTTCYPAFVITAEVPVIYMHQFWATIIKHKSSYQFKIDKKRFSVNVEVFREIPNICHKVPGKAFDEPPTEEEALSFIRKLGHTIEIKYITDVIVDHLHQPWRTFASIINKCLCGKEDLAYQIDNIDSKKQHKMFFLRFMKIIIHHFLEKDKFISMRNRMSMHAARDDSLLDSTISSEESPSKKKYTKAKKVVAPKPKPTKKKTLVKADRGKGLNVLSEVALFEVAQLKDVTKRSKKDFHISHASGSSDGTDFESGVPDDEKESWGDSGEEDEDDENDSEDKSDDGDDDDDGNDGNDDDDANDDDNQEGYDTNHDDEETDSDRIESDIIKILVLNQYTTKYYEEEEEKIDDEEMMDDEEDDEVTNKLYKDVNVNLGQQNVSQESRFEKVKEDDHVTLTLVLDTQKDDKHIQSSFVSYDFTCKLLNL